MPTIQQLIAQYFPTAADIEVTPGERVPDPGPMLGNQVTYFIDGNDYFGALKKEVATLTPGGTQPYFYIANWWLGLVAGPNIITSGPGSIASAWTDAAPAYVTNEVPMTLDDGTGGPFPQLIDQLEAMSRNGVDVRALVWASPVLLTYELAAKQVQDRWAINCHSLLSAAALRKRQGMKNKVVLNTLAHTLGAMHLKMVICGDAAGMRAYVSGLDLVSDRIASWKHPAGQGWHDGGARVEGPAAKVIYDYYRSLWGEQCSRKIGKFLVQGNEIASHTDDTDLVPDRTAPALFGPGKQHVEVLRTLPQMNFGLGATAAVPLGCLPRLVSGARQDPISFAPNGVFEFRLALHKAISAAQQYVYIEDQAFSSFEVMGWLNARLGQQPGLKIIMVYGADPSDPPNAAMHEAVKTKLVAGIGTPMSNIAFYVRWGIVVHTKITIVDDQWAAIGSANSMRRSLYTDGECSIGVLDEDTPTFAQKLRRDLWGELCGLDPGSPRDVLTSPTDALAIWDNTWGPLPSVAALKSGIERMNLSPSFEYKFPKVVPADLGKWELAAPPTFNQVDYDRIDGDSRNEY